MPWLRWLIDKARRGARALGVDGEVAGEKASTVNPSLTRERHLDNSQECGGPLRRTTE